MPLGFVTAFWPAQAIQSVGSIWYGMWGGIASVVFPIISNAMSGSAPLPVSLAYCAHRYVLSSRQELKDSRLLEYASVGSDGEVFLGVRNRNLARPHRVLEIVIAASIEDRKSVV